MDFAIRAPEPDVHQLHDQARRKKREAPPREFEEQLEHAAPNHASPTPERAPHGGDEAGIGERLDVIA